MNDFTFLSDYYVVVVMVACLILGYIIKHASFMKWLPNNDIPAVLAVVGLALNMVVSGPSVEAAVYGALMGLSSTGMHQAFTRFIEGSKNNETENSESSDSEQ